MYHRLVFGRPFIKQFALCYGTVVCLVCLSVTLVHCGQTVGWIKIPLGMEVGLGPGQIVLDGDPALQGAQQPHFSTRLLWPNGWIDQDATWCRGGPRPTRHCIRWGPSSNNGKGHTHTHTPNGKGHSSPHFLAHVYLIVVKRSPISATAELLLLFVFHAYFTIQCVRFTCC